MKKKFLLVASIAAALGFASCNGDEIARLQQSNDSLRQMNDKLQAQNDDEMKTITQVMDQFAEIREAQLGLSNDASSTEGITEDKKQKIQENFKLIQEKFSQNTAKLDSLQSEIEKGNQNLKKYAGTIASLRKQVKGFQTEIANLKKQLEDKDVQIADIQKAHEEAKMQFAAQKASDDSIRAAREAEIKAQDIAMHTVYYIIDNKSNLKAKGLKAGLKKGEAKESYCTKVDYREFEGNSGINFKKEPELYSFHAPGTYTIKKNADKTYTFTITNPSKFWNTKTMVLCGEKK